MSPRALGLPVVGTWQMWHWFLPPCCGQSSCPGNYRQCNVALIMPLEVNGSCSFPRLSPGAVLVPLTLDVPILGFDILEFPFKLGVLYKVCQQVLPLGALEKQLWDNSMTLWVYWNSQNTIKRLLFSTTSSECVIEFNGISFQMVSLGALIFFSGKFPLRDRNYALLPWKISKDRLQNFRETKKIEMREYGILLSANKYSFLHHSSNAIFRST